MQSESLVWIWSHAWLQLWFNSSVSLVCASVCAPMPNHAVCWSEGFPVFKLPNRWERKKWEKKIDILSLAHLCHNFSDSVFYFSEFSDYANFTPSDSISTPHSIIYSVSNSNFISDLFLAYYTVQSYYPHMPKSRGENPARWGDVCAAEGWGSHLLDRSLLKERNKGISSRYVNVNLQREKERKQKDKHWSNGQASTALGITDSDTDAERATVSGLVFLIEGRRGFHWSEMDSSSGLECVYMRVNLSLWLHVTASASACCCVWDHVYTISECLPCR